MAIVVVVMVIKEGEGGGGGEWEGYSCIRLAGVETNKNSYKSHWQTSAGLYAVWKWEVRKREKSIIIQIQNICWIDWFFHFKDFIYLLFFLERGQGREKERERNITCPQLGTWPTTQACALTGNQTGDHPVCRPALNPLSHTSQGQLIDSWMFFSFACPPPKIGKTTTMKTNSVFVSVFAHTRKKNIKTTLSVLPVQCQLRNLQSTVQNENWSPLFKISGKQVFFFLPLLLSWSVVVVFCCFCHFFACFLLFSVT